MDQRAVRRLIIEPPATTMKVDLGKSGTIAVGGADLDTLRAMLGHTEHRYLCSAVRASFRRLASILAQKDADPLLDDVDAWLAAVLVASPVPSIDAGRLSLLLEAWEDAEAALTKPARLALRTAARLVEAVLSVPDRAAFLAASPPLIDDLDDEAASLCAAYLEAVRDEKRPSRSAAARQHYLQRRLHQVRQRLCDPAADAHGWQWVARRLTAARDVVAPVDT